MLVNDEVTRKYEYVLDERYTIQITLNLVVPNSITT